MNTRFKDDYVDVPPLGLEPKEVHDKKRIKAINDAIERYMKAGLPIPSEWVVEYNALIEK